MHDDFLVHDITAKTLEYVHITEKEKDIAEHLINNGYLVKKECRNLEEIKLQSFYELKVPRQGVNTLDSGDLCKTYQLASVVGSNAFLGKELSWLLAHEPYNTHTHIQIWVTLASCLIN